MSPTNMVKRLAGLVGTGDVSPWEDQFIQSILRQTQQGDNTTSLTDKQLDVIERIFSKNFAG